MFPLLPGGWAAVVAIALTPAALRWWWGRSLSRLADDPVLPERLAAHNQRLRTVTYGCAVLLFLGWSSWAVWSLPLLLVTQPISGFPLRKTLYQETWSLGARLSFLGRLLAGAFGFWGLLVCTPWLASRAGRLDWAAAALLALILACWNWYSDAILRALWRTRPIADPALTARFDALVSACGLPMPRFEYVPMGGGVFANAVALPSLRRSSVIFTETLLSRLSADEAAAICAHELAHLEYYTRARLRGLHAVNYLLIATAASIPPVARRLSGSPELWALEAIWWCALLTALVVRARHRQRNETASDLRAVALTGDADALARGLITLHTVSRVPRRWDERRERASTHPSLARRIRDIRAGAGVAATTLTPSASFGAAAGPARVTFNGAHLAWEENAGATHLLDYAALVELRLHASASGAVTLVAVERQGRRWQLSPNAEDLPAIQSVLDVVDGRLAHVSQVPALPPAVIRLVAMIAWSFAFTIGQFTCGFVAMLAVISPAPLLLNGAGAASLVAAALLLRDGTPWGVGSVEVAALFAALGAGLLGLGWMRRAESVRGAGPLLAVLGVSSALAVAAIGFGGLSPIRLHQAARSAPGTIVLLVALAAACWTWRSRRAFRYASLAAVLAAGAIAGLGSMPFLDRVARDPFLMPAPPVTWTALEGPAATEFDVPFNVETLRLSPHARIASVKRMDDDDSAPGAGSPVFHVGRPGGTFAQLDAADIAFVDDGRALVLAVRDGAAEVRDVNLDDLPVITWRERIPDIRWGSLTFEAQSNRWIVLGRDTAGRLVRAAGTVGAAGTERTTWNAPADALGWVDAVGAHAGAALVVQKRYTGGAIGGIPLPSIAMLLGQSFESRLWRLSGGHRIDAGRSLLDTSCGNGALGDDRLVCAVFDGTRTRIVTIDVDSGSVAALTTIDGRFRTVEKATRGWLTGWAGSRPVALRLATREAIHPPVPVHEYVNVVAATDAVIGTVAWKDGGSRIRVYPLPHAPSIVTRKE